MSLFKVHCKIFVLAVILCCANVINAASVDVPCTTQPLKACLVEEAVHIQEGDTLNFLNVDDPNNVLRFDLHDPSRVKFVPADVFEKFPLLTDFVLRGVGVETLSADSFSHAENLKNLELSKNQLAVIPKNVFSKLANLVFLDLTFNQIAEIEDGALNNLDSLNYLFLSGNRLTTIKRGTFAGAPKLREIDLRSNSLEQIEDGAFDLPELTNVVIRNNLLKSVSSNLFLSAPRLEQLDLSTNLLANVGQAFEKLTALNQLTLDNNPTLQDIKFAALIALPALSSLSLKNTSLTLADNVANEDTVATSHLVHLHLTNNNLSRTDLLSLLSSLKNLEELFLNNNKLTRLDNVENIKTLLPQLKEIGLSKNKLDCKWLEEAQSVFKQNDIYAGDIDCVV